MIYYAHINEDNQLERDVMFQEPITHLYVIAGSGERVLALLDHPGLEVVHVIDNNRHALHLCALKLAALKHLSVTDYLAFIGFYDATKERLEHFMALKTHLSEDSCKYWEARKHTIEKGVCNCGHFEQFIHRANPLLRFFLGKRFFQCFDTPKANWKHFPSFRWNLVKRIFSYRWTYRILGMKDPAFISKDAALRAIPDALQKSMDEDRANESCLFHLIFKGNLRDMPDAFLPPSFQKSVLVQIKSALMQDKIKIFYHCEDLLAALKSLQTEVASARFFSLSDILSFADMDYMKAVICLIKGMGGSVKTVVFRTFVRNRLSVDALQQIRDEFGTVLDLSNMERTHFYQVFQTIDLK